MKVVIAGSRHLYDVDLVAEAVAASGFTPTLVIEGGAKGIDRAARHWAEREGIPVQTVEAAWAEHGRRAGPLRNREMSELAEAVICIPHPDPDKRKGTRDMWLAAIERKLPRYAHTDHFAR